MKLVLSLFKDVAINEFLICQVTLQGTDEAKLTIGNPGSEEDI